jgi:hypothetical protein
MIETSYYHPAMFTNETFVYGVFYLNMVALAAALGYGSYQVSLWARHQYRIFRKAADNLETCTENLSVIKYRLSDVNRGLSQLNTTASDLSESAKQIRSVATVGLSWTIGKDVGDTIFELAKSLSWTSVMPLLNMVQQFKSVAQRLQPLAGLLTQLTDSAPSTPVAVPKNNQFSQLANMVDINELLNNTAKNFGIVFPADETKPAIETEPTTDTITTSPVEQTTA